MRIGIALLFALHGLVHLLGVAHALRPGSVRGMAGETLVVLPPTLQRAVGVLWLAAACLLLGAAFDFVRQGRLWCVLGTAGVLLSQVLVVYAWPDAKAGTLPNVLLSVVLALGWAMLHFDRQSDALVGHLANAPAADNAQTPVADHELSRLPEPVQRWLRASGVVGRPRGSMVRLTQTGRLRTAPNAAFMTASAHQTFRVDAPAFVWIVRTRMFGVLPIRGRDTYLEGRGRMLITLGGLIPVVDAHDAQVDEGTLLRFLGELAWFPSAALADYLHWEARDDDTAQVTMTYRGVEASAELTIDAHGRVTTVSAQRFMGGGADAKRTPWGATMTRWASPGGMLIPVEGRVWWRPQAGEFDYYRFAIDAIAYE